MFIESQKSNKIYCSTFIILFKNDVKICVACDGIKEASAYYAPNNLCIYNALACYLMLYKVSSTSIICKNTIPII